jgi:hypothetical protein
MNIRENANIYPGLVHLENLGFYGACEVALRF